jgi:hypothetical protein
MIIIVSVRYLPHLPHNLVRQQAVPVPSAQGLSGHQIA